MNNVLGEAFIKLFHEKTAHLEEGGPRLLHVDSHSSHVSLGLLDFAIKHKIIVLGYPPHTTNLTQGLDVVVFAAFKQAYAKQATKHYDNTGREVEKGIFLRCCILQSRILSRRLISFVPGAKPASAPLIVPLFPTSTLPPAKLFSTTRSLPLAPFSPIRAVVDAIHRQNRLTDAPPSPPLRLSSRLLSIIGEESMVNFSQDNLSCRRRLDWTVPGLACPSGSVELLTEISGLNTLLQRSSDGLDALNLGNSSPPPPIDESQAINTAGEILRSITTTPKGSSQIKNKTPTYPR